MNQFSRERLQQNFADLPFGPTTMMLGALPTCEMGVKSATASYGSLPPRLGPIECVLLVASNSV